MAAEATQADNAIARDQAQQAMAREYRLGQLRSKRLTTDSSAIKPKGAVSDALAQVKQLEELVKKARNVRTILTILGGLASFTLLGIIWTFLQWNFQALVTVFAPSKWKDFIGMPWWMVGVTVFFDVVVIILLVVVVFIGYATVHPLKAFCVMMKPLFGEHWYTTMIQKSLEFIGQCPK